MLTAPVWFGKLLLSCVMFMTTLSMATHLLKALYAFGLSAGMQIPPSFFQEHFFLLPIASGFIAGYCTPSLFRADFVALLRTGRIRTNLNAGLNTTFPWVWLVFSCFLIYGVAAWVQTHTIQSVLATSTPSVWSSTIAHFAGNNCPKYPPRSSSTYEVENCYFPLIYTGTWLASIAFSVGALLYRRFQHDEKKSL